jgi:ankyrin repeat protein
MKHILLTTIAAVVLVGCGPAKAPDISIWDAAMSGNIEAVKQHLDAGANVYAKGGRNGTTPLDRAIANKKTETADLLRKHGGKTGLELRTGITPLHQAARDGQTEIVELLIAKGADVNAKMEDGDTPLDGAIDFKHPELADLLRKHGGMMAQELKAEGK